MISANNDVSCFLTINSTVIHCSAAKAVACYADLEFQTLGGSKRIRVANAREIRVLKLKCNILHSLNTRTNVTYEKCGQQLISNVRHSIESIKSYEKQVKFVPRMIHSYNEAFDLL